MTRIEALLLTQVFALAVIAVGIVYAYEPTMVQRTLRLIAPPVVTPQPNLPAPAPAPPIVAAASPEPALALDAGAEPAWVPLEQLAMVSGPWRTEDGTVLVSVSPRGAKAKPGDEDALWRVTVVREQRPIIACGVYEGLQWSGELPWRLGYCRGLQPEPAGPAEAAKVSLFRLPGQEWVRLIVGVELDVELVQVQ